MQAIRQWLKRAFSLSEDNTLMLASYGTIVVAIITLFSQASGHTETWRIYSNIGILIMILGLNTIFANSEVFTNPQPLYFSYFVIVLLCFWLMLVIDYKNTSFYLIFMFIAQVFVVWPAKRALIYTCIAILGSVLLLRYLSPQVRIFEMLTSVGIGALFAATFAVMVRRYGEQTQRATQLLNQLQVANQELEQARDHEKELAVAQERLRLARDIHDGLGHHLTVLTVQLQAAAKLLDRDPQRAKTTLDVCRTEANAALDEVRHSVATMRNSPLAGRTIQQALQKLVADFSQHTEMQVDFVLYGEQWQTVPVIDDTLYRTAQEGLTNAHKHGHASNALIKLHYHNEQICLSVQDNGMPKAIPTQAGYGLAGLRERAEQLGGACRSEQTPAGFMLEVCLPRTAKPQTPEIQRKENV